MDIKKFFKNWWEIMSILIVIASTSYNAYLNAQSAGISPNQPIIPMLIGFVISALLMIIAIARKQIQLDKIYDAQPIIGRVEDDMLEAIRPTPSILNRYGAASAFSHYLANYGGEKYLVYVDFFNKPKDGNTLGIGIGGYVEFLDAFTGNVILDRDGRWIEMPEVKEEKIHRTVVLPADGHTAKRLGIALIDIRDPHRVFALDGKAISGEGEFLNTLTELEIKPYVLKITLFGSNLLNSYPLYFDLIINGPSPYIKFKENGTKWQKKAHANYQKMKADLGWKA